MLFLIQFSFFNWNFVQFLPNFFQFFKFKLKEHIFVDELSALRLKQINIVRISFVFEIKLCFCQSCALAIFNTRWNWIWIKFEEGQDVARRLKLFLRVYTIVLRKARLRRLLLHLHVFNFEQFVVVLFLLTMHFWQSVIKLDQLFHTVQKVLLVLINGEFFHQFRLICVFGIFFYLCNFIWLWFNLVVFFLLDALN